jgi:hypothetical protein
MSNTRWFNPRLPQTLQGVILFSYLNAAFALFGMVGRWGSGFGLLLIVGAVGAIGVANERRWGYWLCAVIAIVFFVIQLLLFIFSTFVFASMINLLFSVFLIALVFHPMSRSYQRAYFH